MQIYADQHQNMEPDVNGTIASARDDRAISYFVPCSKTERVDGTILSIELFLKRWAVLQQFSLDADPNI